MLILGIETSCDEAAASVVKDGATILSNVIFSQADIHAQFGGVYPEVASREHVALMLPTIERALKKARVTLDQIDLIAVTYAPGLVGSLLIGLNTAKALAMAYDIPFVGVNHVEAHLYSAMMPRLNSVKFPALGLVLSGGHTFMVKIDDVQSYELLGTTVDDAIGESFDKVAKMLKLGYPGGPIIEKLAKKGSFLFPFKPGKVKANPLNFSFSGLKTSVLYALQQNPEAKKEDIAASFQAAAFEDVKNKIQLAKKVFDFEEIYIGGGVTASRALKNLLKDEKVFYPEKGLSEDNAAMIAGLAFHLNERSSWKLTAKPRISLFETPSLHKI